MVHSLTKYLGGHGNSIGGIIVDSGKFPGASTPSAFARLNTPDVSYHGVNCVESAGPRCLTSPARPRGAAAQYGRDHLTPFNSFLILQGIETGAAHGPHLRNAQRVAEHLASHPAVSWVEYAAGLADNASKPLVDKYMGGRALASCRLA